jgi:hypothetical protein
MSFWIGRWSTQWRDRGGGGRVDMKCGITARMVVDGAPKRAGVATGRRSSTAPAWL